jgi:hypothetical protein
VTQLQQLLLLCRPIQELKQLAREFENRLKLVEDELTQLEDNEAEQVWM